MRRSSPVFVSLLLLSCARGAEEGQEGVTPTADASAQTEAGADATTETQVVEDSAIPFDLGVDTGAAADAVADAVADGETGPTECVAAETCGDGLDNDCNGKVDDGCPCQPGRTVACYRGAPSTRGKGVCADGKMTCEGSGEFGSWGPCAGDTVPAAEVCEAAGVDENCNGTANEGCECTTGAPPIACGSSAVGACKKGKQECIDGKLGPCVGAIEPKIEECNGLDDDCDGAVDEGLTRACGSSVGACKEGTQTCVAGAWGDCSGALVASPEKCNGVDDDCDGKTDEDIVEACGSSVGACKQGVRTCVGGTFGACVGEVLPSAELCDNVDNDCDGTVDEDLTRTCGTDVGECVSGKQTCVAGGWGACAGEVTAKLELCDGVKDEDCDGLIDEGCSCTAGATRACGVTLGVCKAGTQTCQLDGTWGACAGEVKASAELCDGLDNDCDGVTDEGCACKSGDTRPCGSSVGECKQGIETCDLAGVFGTCVGASGPTPETCNLKDDDCDGSVDEGGVCPKFPPAVTCPGATSAMVGTASTLTGSGSDPDGGSVTYQWTVSSAPTGSTATPSTPTSAITSFTPDAAGSYVLQFCVTDDELVTSCCTVTLTAGSPCTPPTAPTASTCGTSWDRRPILEFTPIASGLTYQVFKSGDAAPLATLTTVGQNYFRPAAPLGAGAAPPGLATSLYVKACRTTDPTCCATSALVTAKLVEDCTTPIAATADNILFSEYIIDGDGACGAGATNCEAGEAIEITNLSHCPVKLDGTHFSYCNGTTCTNPRYMNFGAAEVIPPRGVYVAIRDAAATLCDASLGADSPGLFGLKVSTLTMQGDNLASGWFSNSTAGSLRLATGAWTSATGGTTLALVSPYKTGAGECNGTGFNAIDACGEVAGGAIPSTTLTPNQLGRLWHPCDAIVSPVPSTCK